MSEVARSDDLPEVDLTNCDREPIQFLGHVQAFGCMIVLSPEWFVVHASENVKDLLGLDPKDLIGRRLASHLGEKFLHRLRTRVQLLSRLSGSARDFDCDVLEDGRKFDISAHYSDRNLIVEFEPRSGAVATIDDLASVQSLIARVRQKDDPIEACREAAKAVQRLTGMDRVMVYRFEEDDAGTVIAEVKSPDAVPYLGLRYPASDIPKQARLLYTKNPIRIIPDVNAATYALLPMKAPNGQPLDLTHSICRAVSPMHLEYLRNMGVAASMSASIMRKGKLWGLFACHNSSPVEIGYSRRSAVELFVELFSYELAQLETDIELSNTHRARLMHDRLMSQMSEDQGLIEAFDMFSQEIGQVIDFDGIAVYSDGKLRLEGHTPTADEFMGLTRFLNTTAMSEVYATDAITSVYPEGETFSDRVAGMLVLPISRRPRDYLVLFRQELARTVNWAGNPEKPVELGPHGARLTPRKSFDIWKQVVRGKSAYWKTSELTSAEALRVTLLEVVLKLSDAVNLSRKRAQEQQELLIAELNHRVRNILNLIQGLVSRGAKDAENIKDYVSVLDDRIHALALAHDQLTTSKWGWLSLNELIQNEIRAFAPEASNQIALKGDDLALSPTGFTTLALVIHELMTNATKYGVLSGDIGKVEIETRLSENGEAQISWREHSGPPVQAPTRRGFGTTIIEQSIPYELSGAADLRFELTGIHADFSIPAMHVRAGAGISTQLSAGSSESGTKGVRLEGEVLLVEDNMIVAMDTSDMLLEMGASHVHTASRVKQALELLADRTFSLAVLDVNLGNETSREIAKTCKEMEIPVVLATGYGNSTTALNGFEHTTILTKPFSYKQLEDAVDEVT